jgi:hypothetical protein
MKHFYLILFILSFIACHRNNDSSTSVTQDYLGPIKVQVIGYNGNLMEPFISRDGHFLLFNNLNAAPENTNLHWAARINDSTFQYSGEISGINTPDLDAVASLDRNGILYFVSTRNYSTTLSTIYQCNFNAGVASNVQLVKGISKQQAGWVNFDVESSADGNTLYFVDGQFDQSGNPFTADIVIARKVGDSFQRWSGSNQAMKNINTDALEYAACISADELELYFTRLSLPLNSNSVPGVFVAHRKTKNDAFDAPLKIGSISGFAEAATIAPDQRTIYFHMRENGKFQLYMSKKK